MNEGAPETGAAGRVGQLRLEVLANACECVLEWTGVANAAAPSPFSEHFPALPVAGADLPRHCLDVFACAADTLPADLPAKAAPLLRLGGVLRWLRPDPTRAALDTDVLERTGFSAISHQNGIAQAVKLREVASVSTSPTAAPAHRSAGYALATGDGLEIGALNEPAQMPAGCRVSYFDVLDEKDARARFPEIDPAAFVPVDFLGDLDRGGLAQFPDGRFDFVVCNHVIEHVANPIRLIQELFRLTRPGGHVILAAPDKRYTFDHERALTTPEHLWTDFRQAVTENSDDHYWDFIRHVVPHVLQESPENQKIHLQRCRDRKEHAHVWDSFTFRAMLDDAFSTLGISAHVRYESTGDENRLEYFGVWQKSSLPPANPPV